MTYPYPSGSGQMGIASADQVRWDQISDTPSKSSQLRTGAPRMYSCWPQSACPESIIRNELTDFYTTCSNGFTSSPDSDTLPAYDALYVLPPFSGPSASKTTVAASIAF